MFCRAAVLPRKSIFPKGNSGTRRTAVATCRLPVLLSFSVRATRVNQVYLAESRALIAEGCAFVISIDQIEPGRMYMLAR